MIPLKNAVPSRYPPVVTWILIATNCLRLPVPEQPQSTRARTCSCAISHFIPARYTAGLAYGELTLGDFVT